MRERTHLLRGLCRLRVAQSWGPVSGGGRSCFHSGSPRGPPAQEEGWRLESRVALFRACCCQGSGGFLAPARSCRTSRPIPNPSPPTPSTHRPRAPSRVSGTCTERREVLLGRGVEAVGHRDRVNVQKVTARKGKTSWSRTRSRPSVQLTGTPGLRLLRPFCPALTFQTHCGRPSRSSRSSWLGHRADIQFLMGL